MRRTDQVTLSSDDFAAAIVRGVPDDPVAPVDVTLLGLLHTAGDVQIRLTRHEAAQLREALSDVCL